MGHAVPPLGHSDVEVRGIVSYLQKLGRKLEVGRKSQMQSIRCRLRARAGGASVLAFVVATLGALPVAAQTWPTKPVTIVVPFPAGGGTDAFGRPLAAKLGEQLGQSFIIDNRGGAGGTLGAGIAARAPKDGYTYLMGAVHHTIAPSIYPKLTYDLEKDLQ